MLPSDLPRDGATGSVTLDPVVLSERSAPEASIFRLQILGALDLRDDHGLEARAILTQPRRLALLAYLAVTAPRGFQRRDRLLAMFWPEQDDEHARAALNRGDRPRPPARAPALRAAPAAGEAGLSTIRAPAFRR